MKASIVIPTYNQSMLLEALFASIEALEFTEPFEVILADDCSTDDTASRMARWMERDLPFERQYVKLPTNGGPGRARNAGARAARGELVAFTDTDCRVSPQWLQSLVEAMEHAEGIAGVGGVVLPTNDTLFAQYLTFLHVLEPPGHVPYLVSCNCIYRREAFLDVGGFPEDIGVPGGEDIEASIKLWKRGWRFGFVPHAVVHHEHRDTWRSFARTWRNYGYGTGLVVHRSLSREERAGMAPNEEHFWNAHFLMPRPQTSRARYVYAEWRRQRRGWLATAQALGLWAVERVMYLYGWILGVRRAQREERYDGGALKRPK